MNFIISALVSAVIAVGSFFGIQATQEKVGANVLPIAGATYNLSGGGISSSVTSITLQSLTLPQTGQPIQDSDLSDTFFITLEPGNRTKQEIASCTTVTQNGGGTATLSGCTRGLSPLTPYTASSTLQFSHAGGTQVIFSDPPQLFNQYIPKDANATSTGIHTWASTTPPRYDLVPINHNSGTHVSTTSEFASVAYVNQISFNGGVNGSETVKGIFELATALEAASSTSSGGTSARLVIPSSMATDTPQRGCAVGYESTAGAGCSLIARLSGKIRQSWLDLTEHFAITSAYITTASSTNATTTNLTVTGNAIFQGTVSGVDTGTLTLTAGEALSANDAVYITDAGTAKKATGTSTPIAFDAGSEGTNSGATSLTFSHTVASQNGRVLLVGVEETTSSTISSVTYAGTAMTLVDSNQLGAGTTKIYVYKLMNPATGANDVVITRSGSTGNLRGRAVSYYGAGEIGIFNQGDTLANTTASGSIATTTVNSWIVLFTYNDNEADYTSSTGVDNLRGSFSNGFEVADTGEGQATTPLNFTAVTGSAGTNHAWIILELMAGYNQFVGFTQAAISNGASGSVKVSGIVDGFTGLAMGRKYYVSSTTPGSITTTITSMKAGVALSATKLIINSIW